MLHKLVIAGVLAGTLLFTGCEWQLDDEEGSSPIDLSKVVWLHANVSEWEETGVLSSVTFDGTLIHLVYDKTDVWPNNSLGINANTWIFVKKSDGLWYAATFEFMRAGYTTRGMNTINAAHIKSAYMDDWRVESGVEYGWMVSGLMRGGNSNVKERTNVFMAQWP